MCIVINAHFTSINTVFKEKLSIIFTVADSCAVSDNLRATARLQATCHLETLASGHFTLCTSPQLEPAHLLSLVHVFGVS